MTSPSAEADNPPRDHSRANDTATPPTKDPTDTDHPTGTEQAAENAATENPA